ncbi:MAG: hypothetical protein NTZ45_00140 [Methylococcales bacterium]|nr:hypothetical protein [Methylococcales bacterium]
MQNFTLNQAAKVCHKSKSSILDAIRSGRLSAKMNEKKQWQIEPSELHRVYPYRIIAEPASTEHVTLIKNHYDDHKNQMPNINLLLEKEKQERERERIQLSETIEDLRNRLTQSENERRSTQEKLTLLLTHQPMTTTPTTKAPKSYYSTSRLWKKIFKR